MNHQYPLPTHPEFSVLEYPGYREYRVENTIRSNTGSNKWASNFWSPWWLAPFITFSWQNMPGECFSLFFIVYVIYILRYNIFRVLSESVIVLPPHGIQLETHRGFSKQWPLLSKIRFIPSANLEGVVINEGLKGWNVLYYLVAIKCTDLHGLSLEVAYQDLLPCHSILLEVLAGVHEVLLSSPAARQKMEDVNIPH